MMVIPGTYLMKVIPGTYLMMVIPGTYLMMVIPGTYLMMVIPGAYLMMVIPGKSLGVRKPNGCNKITKIGFVHLCLKDENLNFNNNYREPNECYSSGAPTVDIYVFIVDDE
jgi:hypothetical protein